MYYYKIVELQLFASYLLSSLFLCPPLSLHSFSPHLILLVNNVGVGYDHAEYFANLSSKKIQDLIAVNVQGTVQMTYLVLPNMIQR